MTTPVLATTISSNETLPKGWNTYRDSFESGQSDWLRPGRRCTADLRRNGTTVASVARLRSRLERVLGERYRRTAEGIAAEMRQLPP
jgi:hypothetical protein